MECLQMQIIPIYYLIAAPIVGVLAVAMALFFLRPWMLKQPEGSKKMREAGNAIKDGAMEHFQKQIILAGVFTALMFLVIWLIKGSSETWTRGIWTALAFLLGAVCAGLVAYLGLEISTRSGSRVAESAKKDVSKGLTMSFKGGAVAGIVGAGIGLLGLSIAFLGLYYIPDYQDNVFNTFRYATDMLVGFGLGAVLVALTFRFSGGIFSKSADIGADVGGKLDSGLKEDDARNPATIADHAGDNIGEVGGAGLDMFSSFVCAGTAAILMAFLVLGTASNNTKLGETGEALMGRLIMSVLFVMGVGVIAAIAGTLMVRTGEKASQGQLVGMWRVGLFVTAGVTALGTMPIFMFYVGWEDFAGLWFAVLTGIAGGLLVGFNTEAFTTFDSFASKGFQQAQKSGPVANILRGWSMGLFSAITPIFLVALTLIISYLLAIYNCELTWNFEGNTVHIYREYMGLLGVAMAALGMVSVMGFNMAATAFGAITDNSKGIAEIGDIEQKGRKRVDALSYLGNMASANSKGFMVISGAMTALAIVGVYIARAGQETDSPLGGQQLSDTWLYLYQPYVMIGILLGAIMPIIYCAFTIGAVGKTAQAMIDEVKKQLKDIKGLADGKAKPDSYKCLKIASNNAIQSTIIPGALAVIAPILIGVILGPAGLAAFIIGAVAVALALSAWMANTGSMMNSAKGFQKTGEEPKKADEGRAAILGDILGDAMKDSAAGSMMTMVKVLAVVALVLVTFVSTSYFLR